MRQRVSPVLLVVACVLAASTAGATPTTNVWNPNTDVQAKGVLHLGIDDYFSIFDNDTRPYAFNTLVGLTYGLGAGFEVGVDFIGANAQPFVFNAKWGLPEGDALPAVAVGVQQLGAKASGQASIYYGLLAKSFEGVGRFTVGGYSGLESVLGADNSGFIAAWDKALSERWWASIDYASGNNAYGALAFGASYKLAPNVGLLFGYVVFNEGSINPNDVFTAQLDVDF